MFKYRLSISDGQYRFSHAVLMLESEDDVPPDLAVIKINVTDDKNSIKMINNKLIFVVGSFKVVQITEDRLGNPLPIHPKLMEHIKILQFMNRWRVHQLQIPQIKLQNRQLWHTKDH